jgi:hypothetical protein
MPVGVKCRRPSEHGCDIHPKRDQLAMDMGFLQRCTASPKPEEAGSLPLFTDCQPAIPLLKQAANNGDSP